MRATEDGTNCARIKNTFKSPSTVSIGTKRVTLYQLQHWNKPKQARLAPNVSADPLSFLFMMHAWVYLLRVLSNLLFFSIHGPGVDAWIWRTVSLHYTTKNVLERVYMYVHVQRVFVYGFDVLSGLGCNLWPFGYRSFTKQFNSSPFGVWLVQQIHFRSTPASNLAVWKGKSWVETQTELLKLMEQSRPDEKKNNKKTTKQIHTVCFYL